MLNKFRAKRCSFDGYAFDSMAERDCFKLLKLLEKAGDIRDIEVHVTSKLLPGITHKTDFMFYDLKKDCLVWAEYKGMETERWKIIKKIWKIFGPGLLRVYKGTGININIVEEIKPAPIVLEFSEIPCPTCESKREPKH